MIIDSLTPELERLVAAFSSGSRRVLNRKIATTLRTSQSRRIAAQKNPDGSGYAPRVRLRGKKGQVRRMFPSLRKNRFLKIHVTDTAINIGYEGRAAKVAYEHQYGKQKPLLRARGLLGFSKGDVETLAGLFDDHLNR